MSTSVKTLGGAIPIILKGLEYAMELYGSLKPRLVNLVQIKSDTFLNYNPGFLLEKYSAEHPVANGITYTNICDLLQLLPPENQWDDHVVDIAVIREAFSRSRGTQEWQEVSNEGFAALLESGRISSNEHTIRVSTAKIAKRRLKLSLQRATYHDQAYSNLILDFDRDNPSRYVSLRSQLHKKYAEHLPALDDRRLANTLGLAALLFYRSNHQWVPYIVRRVEKIGVFPGGLHCTSSGAAKWPGNVAMKTLSNFATDHMLNEIEEEVGLTQNDLIDFRPIAVCRDMARGGKPQLFYGGFTWLDRGALTDRRKRARKIIETTGQWQEIERDRWFRSADAVYTPSKLRTHIGKWGLTLEGAASLHFGIIYAKARLPYLPVPK